MSCVGTGRRTVQPFDAKLLVTDSATRAARYDGAFKCRPAVLACHAATVPMMCIAFYHGRTPRRRQPLSPRAMRAGKRTLHWAHGTTAGPPASLLITKWWATSLFVFRTA